MFDDPYTKPIDKERTFELMDKLGIMKAVLSFSGGHDSGYVSGITAIRLVDGEWKDTSFIDWNCGGWTSKKTESGSYEYIPINTPSTDEEILSDLFQVPIYNEFGSWAFDFYVEGNLTWDAQARTCVMSKSVQESTWNEYETGF